MWIVEGRSVVYSVIQADVGESYVVFGDVCEKVDGMSSVLEMGSTETYRMCSRLNQSIYISIIEQASNRDTENEH